MRKNLILVVLCCLVLVGCGNGASASYDETEGETARELADNAKEADFIGAFEKAEYDKFNSYASENGLSDTLIYVEGVILNSVVLEDMAEFTLQQEDGNRWTVGMPILSEEDAKIIEENIDQNVMVFGTYTGYSDVFNLPAIALAGEDMQDVRIDRESLNGEFETIWTFSDYANEVLQSEADIEENQDSSESVEDYIPTTGEKNALLSAKSYLEIIEFSYQGLVDQLEYEQYSHSEAVYAADNCGADWNEQALKSALSYLEFAAFSRNGLTEQLEYEGFTSEQAAYGADNCGADWNEQAAKSAAAYLEMTAFSRNGLIEQLEYEGFTHEQAVYGVEANGY